MVHEADSSHVLDTDVARLRALRADDVRALEGVMDLYAAQLATVAELVTHSPELAREAVQDTFVHLWDIRQTLQIQESLLGYLVRVTRRRAIDILRRETSQQRVIQEFQRAYVEERIDSSRAQGDTILEEAELRQQVQLALQGLPPRCREIFLLHREAGLSYAEIEALLGISNATIRNQMSRAAKHIAKHISAGLFKDWFP